jgi:hypothetical protein
MNCSGGPTPLGITDLSPPHRPAASVRSSSSTTCSGATPAGLRGAGQSHSLEHPLLDLDDLARLVAEMPQHLRCLVVVAFRVHTASGK